jgi:small-conductance mechanosensitive channel
MKRFLHLLSLLTILMIGHAAAAAQQAKPSAPPSPAAQEEAPVVLGGKELFRIRQKVLSLSPKERALAISARISRLAKSNLTPRNPVTVFDGETTSDLFVGEMLVLVVTEQDAAAAGTNRTLLARYLANRINSALEAYQEERSLHRLLMAGLYAFLATAALVALLLIFRVIFPRIHAKINSWRTTRIRSVKIQSVEVISADRIAASLITLTRGARAVLTALLFFFYIPLVCSFFPWTSGFAAKFIDYAVAPLSAIGSAIVVYVPNLFFVAVIILVMRYVIKAVGLLFTELHKGNITISGFYPEWADPTFRIVRFLLYAFTAVVVFPYLPGSDSPAFKGVSLFLGILFSLGSTSAIANIVAGVILTYTRAFTIGDRVRINDNTGDVIETNLLATHIRTIKNVDITIPNSLVLGSHILNYSALSRERGLILHTAVTIGYDAPWRRIHELLISAALATEHVLAEPRPFVLQTALNDFYVTYELNAYTDEPHAMAEIYSDLHRNIQDAFNEGGVEIMSPHYAQVRDGNRTTIPAQYLPEGYEPGGIRITRNGRDAPQ